MPISVQRSYTLADGTSIFVRYDRLATVVTADGRVLTFDNLPSAQAWAADRIGHPVWGGWFPTRAA